MAAESGISPTGLMRIPALHPQTAATEMDGQAVIVLADSGQMLALNPAATRLWTLCDGRRSLDELAAILQAEYDVDLARARGDTLALFERLAEIGAVEWVG